MVTLPGTRPPTDGGALAAAGDTVKPPLGEAVEGIAVRPSRFAEARCCCSRRWSGVITWVDILFERNSRRDGEIGHDRDCKGFLKMIRLGLTQTWRPTERVMRTGATLSRPFVFESEEREIGLFVPPTNVNMKQV